METKLLYFDDTYLFESPASVMAINSLEDGRQAAVLDQTIFYPQGGGQPYDQGRLTAESGIFGVAETRFNEGQVLHIGSFTEGEFGEGAELSAAIDKERRLLNSRVHTAGHLIDVCMNQLGQPMEPSKGFHFPEGPYVEYIGEIEPVQRDEVKGGIEEFAEMLITGAVGISSKLVEVEELKDYCDFVPHNIPTDKPVRVVFISDFAGVPCGGTHVKDLSELGSLVVSKIKGKGGNTRVSYRLN